MPQGLVPCPSGREGLSSCCCKTILDDLTHSFILRYHQTSWRVSHVSTHDFNKQILSQPISTTNIPHPLLNHACRILKQTLPFTRSTYSKNTLHTYALSFVTVTHGKMSKSLRPVDPPPVKARSSYFVYVLAVPDVLRQTLRCIISH